MKLTNCIAAALLCFALLAVPAYAETMPESTQESTSVTLPQSDGQTAPPPGTNTTVAFQPISADLEPTADPGSTEVTLPREALLRGAAPQTPLDYIQTNFLSLAALALGVLALLLSVAAMVKSGKKRGRGGRKNYNNYF
ncbi:MAG: hypothetical protein LBG83_03045 [Oscillospiraceae bacterium]|jgi:hypothetical protein|nr:hypothetical protein [Oscillospiraceae bacterium]